MFEEKNNVTDQTSCYLIREKKREKERKERKREKKQHRSIGNNVAEREYLMKMNNTHRSRTQCRGNMKEALLKSECLSGSASGADIIHKHVPLGIDQSFK